jgi:hypothetical protein
VVGNCCRGWVDNAALRCEQRGFTRQTARSLTHTVGSKYRRLWTPSSRPSPPLLSQPPPSRRDADGGWIRARASLRHTLLRAQGAKAVGGQATLRYDAAAQRRVSGQLPIDDARARPETDTQGQAGRRRRGNCENSPCQAKQGSWQNRAGGHGAAPSSARWKSNAQTTGLTSYL